jgi:hypothetical protein
MKDFNFSKEFTSSMALEFLVMTPKKNFFYLAHTYKPIVDI